MSTATFEPDTVESVEFLEGAYAPLLRALRSSIPVTFVTTPSGGYVLEVDGAEVTLSSMGRPLPDACGDVSAFLVDGPSGRHRVAVRYPVLMLVCDLLAAVRQVS